MSDTENTSQPVENAKKVAGNFAAKAMELKDSNPKVFFGAIGGSILLLFFAMTLGGDNGVMPSKAAKELVVGQNYVLKNANSFDSSSKVRLVSVPGSMEAFDDTVDEDPKEATCKHLAQDTQVKVLAFQDFAGKKNAFVNVEILSGPCKGKRNWALSIDVQ